MSENHKEAEFLCNTGNTAAVIKDWSLQAYILGSQQVKTQHKEELWFPK